MATIGWLSLIPPVEPKKRASPKPNAPPSLAASQYPAPDGVAAMATIGRLSLMDPVEPWKAASPRPTPTGRWPAPSWRPPGRPGDADRDGGERWCASSLQIHRRMVRFLPV